MSLASIDRAKVLVDPYVGQEEALLAIVPDWEIF
jgi:hypothetical protein